MKDFTTCTVPYVSRSSSVCSSRLGETNRLLVATCPNRFSDPCIGLKSSPPPPLFHSVPVLSRSDCVSSRNMHLLIGYWRRLSSSFVGHSIRYGTRGRRTGSTVRYSILYQGSWICMGVQVRTVPLPYIPVYPRYRIVLSCYNTGIMIRSDGMKWGFRLV